MKFILCCASALVLLAGCTPYNNNTPYQQNAHTPYDLQGNILIPNTKIPTNTYVGLPLSGTDTNIRQETQQRALERTLIGKESVWTNPDTGNTGTITPTKTYTIGEHYCRHYVESAQIEGTLYESQGNACRNAASGEWQETEQGV